MTLTSNSVYLCGSAKFTASQPGDALLLKYGYDGKKKWERFTAGSGGGNDSWTDVAGDNKAQVHVTGYCTRSGSGEDIVTRLYDSSGSRLWQRILKTGSMDVGTALAVDSSRRTYVCGWRTVGGDQDAIVIMYGMGGATLWKHLPRPRPVPRRDRHRRRLGQRRRRRRPQRLRSRSPDDQPQRHCRLRLPDAGDLALNYGGPRRRVAGLGPSLWNWGGVAWSTGVIWTPAQAGEDDRHG